MCGIFALFSPESQVQAASLQQGVESLHHRGPDGRKIWLSPQGNVGLGHTRLSIIDLTGGEQPLANQDGTLRAVVNGEFYDFSRIQDDLRRCGYPLQTHSDSEIAIHLYDEFGIDCLQHLRGEFAFVLWDERRELLFAARDRFGIKPLYYAAHNDALYLASEAKALFAAGVPARWDRESFCLTNAGLITHNRTLFDNVYQVPPGYFLIASRSGIKLERYWDFDYPEAPDDQVYGSEEDYITLLRETLDEAIRLRMHADVPVGCYLSGGLDSAAVLGMAAAHTNQPIKAFTLAFDQDSYNEAEIAAEMAVHVGASLQVVPISPSDLADNFEDTVFQCETIYFSNTNATAKYLLSRATRDAHYKTVLTGEGADEILGGYAHFRQDMLMHNGDGKNGHATQLLLEELKQRNKMSAGSVISEGVAVESLHRVKEILGFTPAWMDISAMWHRQLSALYAHEFTHQFSQRDIYETFLNQIDVEGQLAGREPINQSLYLWSKTTLPNNILRVLGDGVEMAHSLEGRLPFLDHKVVELVCQMPASLKIKGLTEKYILRQTVKPYITDTIYNRQKHPFMAPHSTLNSSGILSHFVQDTLRSPAMADVPFYNQSAIVKLLDSIPDMSEYQRLAIDPILMRIISACILQKRFGLA